MTLSGRFKREHSPANKYSEEKINQVIHQVSSKVTSPIILEKKVVGHTAHLDLQLKQL